MAFRRDFSHTTPSGVVFLFSPLSPRTQLKRKNAEKYLSHLITEYTLCDLSCILHLTFLNSYAIIFLPLALGLATVGSRRQRRRVGLKARLLKKTTLKRVVFLFFIFSAFVGNAAEKEKMRKIIFRI